MGGNSRNKSGGKRRGGGNGAGGWRPPQQQQPQQEYNFEDLIWPAPGGPSFNTAIIPNTFIPAQVIPGSYNNPYTSAHTGLGWHNNGRGNWNGGHTHNGRNKNIPINRREQGRVEAGRNRNQYQPRNVQRPGSSPKHNTPQLKWSVGLEHTDPADEDSDTVPIDPTEDMLDENEAFLPTFLTRDLDDPLLENQTKTLGLAELNALKLDPDRSNVTNSSDSGTTSISGIDFRPGSDSGGDTDSDSGGATDSERQVDSKLADIYNNLEGVPLNLHLGDVSDGHHEDQVHPSQQPNFPTSVDPLKKGEPVRKPDRKKKRARSKKKDAVKFPYDELIRPNIAARLAAEIPFEIPEDDFDAADASRPSLNNKYIPVPSRKRPANSGRIRLSADEVQEELENALLDEKELQIRSKARNELRAKVAAKLSEEDPVPNSDYLLKAYIQNHLVDFLISKENEFVSPFMTHDQRILFHTAAMKIGAQTTSKGKEPKRFIVVTKRRHTMTVTTREAALQIFNKNTNGSRRNRGLRQGGHGGGGGGGEKGAAWAATRYRHGDVVGADADPVGETSKGHAMLLKLGWEKGKPLGSSGTGLMEPIETVVRLSRTGLG